MTNPNNAVGTNAGFGGRTSPNAFNDVLSMFSFAGIVSGWECVPKSGMTVSIGGDGVVRDVAIAEDNAGNRTTINNRIGVPIDITLPGAPSTGNRYDVIVAYVANPAQGTATDVDYAPATGLIVVSGTAAAQPTYPQDSAIRDAITADGADGSTAYYVQLCSILVGEGVTTIGAGAIEGGTSTETELVYDTAVDDLRDEIIAQRTVLFEDTPTKDNVTLTQAWANFDEIEVYFCSNSSGTNNAQKITFDSACSDFTLSTWTAGASSTAYQGLKRYTVSGTTLTVGNHYQKSYAASAITTQTSTDVVHIYKVVGIKYLG